MDDRQYRALLQQRSYLLETINSRKNGMNTMKDYIDKAEHNILKLRMEIKNETMIQVRTEIQLKIVNIQNGIKNATKEIKKIEEFFNQEQETLNKVIEKINKEKKILAGEYYDDEVEAKEVKIKKNS